MSKSFKVNDEVVVCTPSDWKGYKLYNETGIVVKVPDLDSGYYYVKFECYEITVPFFNYELKESFANLFSKWSVTWE